MMIDECWMMDDEFTELTYRHIDHRHINIEFLKQR